MVEVEPTSLRMPWKSAVIVAVDLMGGFSKDGNIPWHYSEDFLWFQHHTKGNICVMGRTTYDDINTKMGDRGADEVLPGRECYVVTSRPLERSNAVPIPSIESMMRQRTADNAHKTVFFIGGESIYKEAVPMVDEAYVTIVKDIVEADRFFPVDYVAEHFRTVTSHNALTFDGIFTILRRTTY